MTTNQKQNLKLTEWQKRLLVGLLLGDGHLETVNNRTYRLRVEHSEKQKEYLFWLRDQFKDWAGNEEIRPKVRVDGRISYELRTRYHGAFRFYAQQFYSGKKKHIPKLIHKLITAESVAIWFMDDGSKKSARHKTFILHTVGYSYADLLLVKSMFKQVFDLEVNLHKQRNNTWRLYIPSESATAFSKLVYSLIKEIPSMLYKLDNNMPKK